MLATVFCVKNVFWSQLSLLSLLSLLAQLSLLSLLSLLKQLSLLSLMSVILLKSIKRYSCTLVKVTFSQCLRTYRLTDRQTNN